MRSEERTSKESKSSVRRIRSRGRTMASEGIGGFYESILALMVVTAGILVLTASFAFMERGSSDAVTKDDRAAEVMGKLMNDADLFREDRLMERSALDHFEWGKADDGDMGCSLKISVSYQDGSVQQLYDNGKTSGNGDRYVVREPVNVLFNQGDVRAALLTVQVAS
jgi:hypothetical protein